MILSKDFIDEKAQAFTDQYNSYYTLVFSSIHSKIQNFHDAEDITQEVFLRFYNKIDEVENPRRWLFGTLRNVVLDYYKSKDKKKRDVDIESIFEDLSLSFVNGFRDTRLIIEKAMDEIFTTKEDEISRALFDLIAVYNYSFVEASKHLNLSYKKVRNMFHKTVKRLILRLNEMGIRNLEELL